VNNTPAQAALILPNPRHAASDAQSTKRILLIDSRNAARMLSLSDRTLYTLAKSGAIPFVRCGKRGKRFSVAAIERWIAAQEAKSVGTV
jgi:excisionase family DNA binding protein